MQVGYNSTRSIHAAHATGLPRTETHLALPESLQRRMANVRQLPRLSEATVEALKHPGAEANAAGASKKKNPILKDDAGSYKTVRGELFGAGGPKLSDVKQGSLADCFFLSSLGAVAADDPKAIRDAIKDNGDGTYSVRFYKESKPVWVKVDGKLPVDKNGNPAYAKGVDSDGDGKLELWVPIMEKAYAKYKDLHGPKDKVDGYQDLNRGGSAKDAIEALTGRGSRYESTPKSDSELEKLLSAANDGAEVVVGTKDKATDGWVGWHAYTVVGTYEKGGETMVTLRNPWGSTEPNGADKGTDANDGLFSVTMDDLRDQIKGVHTNAKEDKFNLMDWLHRIW